MNVAATMPDPLGEAVPKKSVDCVLQFGRKNHCEVSHNVTFLLDESFMVVTVAVSVENGTFKPLVMKSMMKRHFCRKFEIEVF